MNSLKTSGCPTTDTLNDFILGKLTPPILDECETHVADCPGCLETLQGLSNDDTLTGHIAAALNIPEADRSSQDLDNLLNRILSQSSNEFTTTPSSNGTRGIPAELMADRAAEVLRCLEPSNDSGLGMLGDYDLQRLIGAGSSGVVFQATDRMLNRPAAVKVLRPSLGENARQRFIAEAQSAASLEHPNVVSIYQVGQDKRLAYMAMQWIPGQSLEQQLEDIGQFAESDVRRIGSQIAAGLQAAHQKQIVHRDIKPANIWITEDDQSVRILDFGLARISDDDPGLTATGMLAGTPNFMSPEQAKGLELDGRSDLFSLGCLMYRLLTGRLPFGSPTILATLQAIQNQRPTPIQSIRTDVSDDLADLTMALLEKQPVNRPASAQQLIQMLENKRAQWPININRYQEVPLTQQAAGLSKPTGNSVRIGRWIATAIATVALGFCGMLFGPQIIRIATDQGEVVVETNDPDVQVEILQNGKLVRVLDTQTDQSFNIRSGNYEFQARSKTKPASSVSFDITPQHLVMKRGQKHIVKVSKVSKAVPSYLVPSEDAFGGPAETPLQSRKNVDGMPTERQTPIQKGQTVYDGQTFDQWIQILKTDRSPKTIAVAIKACGTLAESTLQRKQMFVLIGSTADRYGSGEVGGNDDFVMAAMHNAILEQPLPMTIDFVAERLKNGNQRSVDFCRLVMYGVNLSGNTSFNVEKHRLEFAVRSGELLKLAHERDFSDFGKSLAVLSRLIPPETLVKRAPELSETVNKLFWSSDKKWQRNLARLVAHLRTGTDDAKIVQRLGDLYFEELQPAHSQDKSAPFFLALTYQTTPRTTPLTFQTSQYEMTPIVGWNDSIRCEIILRMLDQLIQDVGKKASLEAIAQASGMGIGKSRVPLPVEQIYELQRCLATVLPGRTESERTSYKVKLDKLAPKVKATLLKINTLNTPQRQAYIDNMDALVAICDGKLEPAFIQIHISKEGTFFGTRY